MQLSRSSVRAIAHAAILLSLSTAGAVGASPAVSQLVAHDISKAPLAQLTLPFIANQGQLDPQVAFYAPTFAGTIYVTKRGQVVYSLSSQQTTKSGERSQSGWTLTESFLASSPLKPVAAGAIAAQVSYFMGHDRDSWRTGLPTSERVSLGEAWPGIEVSLEAHGSSVKTFYTLAPEAQVGRIQLALAGTKKLRLEQGSLVAETDLGAVTFAAPRAWQDIAGTQRPVQAAYTLDGQGYGFQLGPHDPHAAVVIDPDLQATFLGGNDGNWDIPMALAIDGSGNVYVTGYTAGTHFPGTVGGAQAANAAGNDAFVAKLNPTLTTLEQATYLGGSGQDSAFAIVLSSSGDVYVAGETSSTDFPGTAGGAQTAINGTGNDGFIAKLNANLTVLKQATYLGGSGNERLVALGIGTGGDIYVAGDTSSTNFPGTTGGAQANSNTIVETLPTLHGVPGQQVTVNVGDTFVAKLNAGLTSLEQATYVGGTGTEYTQGLALDAAGDVYVSGYTYSSDFHGTAGGAQAARDGSTYADAFIAKLDAGLTTLDQATYFGGASDEYGRSLAIGPSGDVYISGDTYSTDIPGTSGGAQAISAGGSEVFLARFNAGLSSLYQATYLGTIDNEWAYSMAIGPSGDVYVAGTTSNGAFPYTAGGAQDTYGGGSSDAYLTRFNAALTQILQSTFFGGTGMDESGFQGNKLAIDAAGDVYLVGDTRSLALPGTAGSYQTTDAEGNAPTVFIASFPADLKLHVDMSLSLGAPSSALQGTSFSYSLSVTDNSSNTAATGVVLTNSLPTQVSFVSAISSQGSCTDLTGTVTCHLGTLAANGGNASVTIAVTGTGTGVAMDQANVSTDQSLSASSISSASVDTKIASSVSISTIPNQMLTIGQSTGALPFSVSGTGALSVSVSSSNAVLVPVANIGISASCGTSNSICSLTATPVVGMTGSSLITLTVRDGYGAGAQASFTLTVSDAAAIANNGSIITKFVGLVRGQLSATKAYAGQTLTYQIVSKPIHGSLLSFDPATGAFAYKSAGHFLGTDSFSFSVKDAQGLVSNIATESITLTPEHIFITKPFRPNR